MDKHLLLARFWANNNQLVTADGIELELEDDNQVSITTTLRTTAEDYYEIVITAMFELDDFVEEMEIQLVEDIMEINIETLMTWLSCGKARYFLIRP